MRRVHPHHCRRAILVGLGLFCALQLVVSVGAPWLMPWMREPVYGRKIVCLRKRIDSTPKSSFLVVVVGSSRTLNGLRGDVVEPILASALGRPVTVFNLGVPGADSFGNLVHLRRLLADGIHPDLVLLEPTLATLLHRDDQPLYWARVFPPSCLRRNEINLLHRYTNESSADNRLEWSLARAFPIYSHRFSLLSKAAPLLLPHSRREDYLDAVDPWGGYRFPDRVLTPEGRKTALAAAKTEYEGLLKQTQVSAANLQALREGVAVCQRKRIPVGLLLMPEGPTFRGWYQPGCAERLVALLEDVSRGQRVPLINARCWFDREEPFIDSHHLTPNGANAFSRRLATEGLLPLLTPAATEARVSASGG